MRIQLKSSVSLITGGALECEEHHRVVHVYAHLMGEWWIITSQESPGIWGPLAQGSLRRRGSCELLAKAITASRTVAYNKYVLANDLLN